MLQRVVVADLGASCTVSPSVAKAWIVPIPLSPRRMLASSSAPLLPIGVKTPIPVTAIGVRGLLLTVMDSRFRVGGGAYSSSK
jgi:hypothetical protein